ncbi:hypothetical protein [Salinicola lusitanus]|uniref:hypothetical protein n=1 Tax=Salinicola lusitanus TaxID=1949085 RepID=UPI000DA1B489|nr:hypothetical protein [Salinicola lusitanus]
MFWNLFKRWSSRSVANGEPASEGYTITFEEIRRAQGMNPEVNGISNYHYAQTHKHDLETMLACCQSEENVYWAQSGSKLSPAPFYFERAAILCKKAKDYSGEVAICERWIAMEEDFMNYARTAPHPTIDISAGPRASKIRHRLTKAIQNRDRGNG